MVPISLDLLQDTVKMEVNQPFLELDLPQMVDLLLKKNLDQAIAQQQVKQAKGRMITTAAQLMPSFTGQYSVEKFKGGEVITVAQPVELDRNTLRPTLTGDLIVETGGRSLFQLGGRYFEMKQAQQAKAQQMQDLLRDGVVAYMEWMRAIYQMEQLTQSLEAAEKRIQVAQARYKNGFGTLQSVTQARTQADEVKARLLAAQNDRQVAEYGLLNKLNLSFDIALLPQNKQFPTIRFEMDEDNVPLHQLVMYAEKHRPDLQEMAYRIKAAKTQLAATVSSLMPRLQLNGYIRAIGPRFNDLTRSERKYMQLDLQPLSNLGVNVLGGVVENRGRIQQAQLERDKVLNDVKQKIFEAYAEVTRYEQEMGLLADKINAVQEDCRVAEARLKRGFGIPLEVSDAQDRLNQVRFEYISARLNYQIAKVKLMAELGMLTPDYLRKNSGTALNPLPTPAAGS
jgi:outer membrane protein TolC